jgi:hypothetical protein
MTTNPPRLPFTIREIFEEITDAEAKEIALLKMSPEIEMQKAREAAIAQKLIGIWQFINNREISEATRMIEDLHKELTEKP